MKVQGRPKHRRAAYFVGLTLFERLKGFTDLEARIAALPTQQDRGDAFEVFAEAYLATQKLVGAEEVWPADQVPIAVLRACCLPVQDLGADGVYKTWAGQYNAYQSKFRTGRPSLTWQELSTFMGLTDQVGERVLFTNCDDLPSVMDARSGFYCVRGTDLERLTKDDLEAITVWLRGAPFTPKRKEPRPHQSEALEAILAGLEQHDRVNAVMACGTGKTLVSLWLAERMNAQRVLVLVPSLALIRQTLHEWLKETAWERPRFIAVCSDPTVTQDREDALVVHQRDLDFPVTTDVSEVRYFLAGPGDRQIVFSTYQSARAVGEAVQGMDAFDLAIFDEAHKTAGREGTNFGFALEDRNLAIAKRVFLTATPRHYDVRKTDKEGDKSLVYSMDEPRTYGPNVYTLSFAEAARRGIICNYKVIISVVTSDMINADLLSKGEVIVEGDVVRAHTVANQIAIQKACKEHDLKKVFSFHRNVASARDFTGDTASSIKTQLPGFEAYHVNGEMQTARREKEMRAFREADRAIMSNARCLTEGVDVPAVDVVAFLSPRKSKVDIVQAAGRAMRTAPGKETGYVLLPLFLEKQENETIEEALERTDFEEAWDVLQAMQEQDAVLAEIVREMREEQGRRGGFDDGRLRERVEVLGPEISLDMLRGAVSTALVDQLSVTWDEKYGELKRYKERFGHCAVPQHFAENPQLGLWVGAQRALQSRGELSSSRKARLDELGFIWDAFDRAWEAMFAKLRSFRNEHGHCNVPVDWRKDPRLGRWVANQRSLLKRTELSPARKLLLDGLGFVWDPALSSWEAMFSKLERYRERQGHTDVPQRGADAQLGIWVRGQRTKHAKGDLSAAQEAQLNALGFVWDTLDAHWEEMFAALHRYRNQEGHCNVPARWQGVPGLATWVGGQRRLQNQKRLPASRKARLDELGFAWDPLDASWEEMFSRLRHYKESHGDCNVPATYEEDLKLGRWVGTQRYLKTAGQLPSERKARLDGLGFVWETLEVRWEEMFSSLGDYKDTHGDCNVPAGWRENPRLATWIFEQRTRYRRGALSADRRARLEALGFAWSIRETERQTAWETMFSKLEAFKDRFGHCNVPNRWAEDPRLANWVSTQRSRKKKESIPRDRQRRLEVLGFGWSRRT